MTNYARLRVMLEASEYSDYGRPDSAAHEATATPDEWYLDRLMEIDTSATTVHTTQFASLTLFMVKNTDTTNYATLTWRSAGNGATDNKVRIGAGEVFVVTDITAGTSPTLAANTAAVLCRISMMGT